MLLHSRPRDCQKATSLEKHDRKRVTGRDGRAKTHALPWPHLLSVRVCRRDEARETVSNRLVGTSARSAKGLELVSTSLHLLLVFASNKIHSHAGQRAVR